MELQLLILLFIIGGVAGALYATTQVSTPLFIVSAVLLFLPALGVELSGVLLPVIATSVVSFIPILLLEWVRDMKERKVDSVVLIALSPGAAIGGVIGAQLVSFMSPIYFKVALSILVLLLVYRDWLSARQRLQNTNNAYLGNLNSHALRMPIGLFIGVVSMMAGGAGKIMAETVLTKSSVDHEHRHSTAVGVALFVSIAAMVGFSFPAMPLSLPNTDGFIGGIQLLSCLVLAVSQMLFYLLCREKGNRLDRLVLTIGFVLFMLIAASRVWLMAF